MLSRLAQIRLLASAAGVVLFCGSGYGCSTFGRPPSVEVRSVPPFLAADVGATDTDREAGATGWQASAAAVTALSWMRRRRVSVGKLASSTSRSSARTPHVRETS